ALPDRASGSLFAVGTTLVTVTATDAVGNTSSKTFHVTVVDTTPPTISGTATTSPNANGWYKGPVTLRFTASDLLRPSSVTPDQTLRGEGANQSVTGTAMDYAGNSASATVSGINVDLTAPTISGAVTAAPNASGWYNGDVTIHWTPADALSGVASVPADST